MKKYTTLGVMSKSKKKDPNDENEPNRYYLKLEQNKGKDGKPYGEQVFPITLANGKVLKDGDTLNLYSKADKFKKLVEEGKMDQEKAAFLSSFLLYDIVLTETVDEDGSGSNNSGGVNF